MNRMAGGARGVLTHLTRGEAGYGTLTTVLILLILGALIITPILAFMGVGLKAGQTHERRTDELYAADAGVNYALWHIRSGQVPEGDSPLVLDEFIMNDKVVSVTVYKVSGDDEPAYRIVSIASSNNTDSSTTVESYVSIAYCTTSLLEAAITSHDNVFIKDYVEGDVICGGTVDIQPASGWVEGYVKYVIGIDGEERIIPPYFATQEETIPEMEYWPEADIFRQLYRSQVNVAEPYPFGIIDVAFTDEIPALYRDIDQDLLIKSSVEGVETKLMGTVYVAGENSLLTIGGPKDFTLDLDKNTIFCEGEIRIDESCIIKGTGAIIAVGDVFFGPQMLTTGEEEDYVIIMSIEGFTDMHPNGDFNGSVVGNTDVELYPGCTLTWLAPNPGELNFPMYNAAEINTYNIYYYVPD